MNDSKTIIGTDSSDNTDTGVDSGVNADTGVGNSSNTDAGADYRANVDTRTNDKINITGIYVNRTDIKGAAYAVSSYVARKCSSGSGGSSGSRSGGSGCSSGSRSGNGSIHACGGAYASVSSSSSARFPAMVCTPNAEIMMEAQNDKLLHDILNAADLVIADGAGVVLASKILGHKNLERVPGFDLVKELLTNPARYPFSFFFLGGKPGVAESAAAKIAESSPNTKISGCRDGYFSELQESDIIEQVNKSGTDILLVALGAPRQEKWIFKNRSRLNVTVCIGVGGSLDVLAGSASLAPAFFRNNGLEWLYRLYKEPRRLRRMLRLPKYVLFAFYWRLFRQGKKE